MTDDGDTLDLTGGLRLPKESSDQFSIVYLRTLRQSQWGDTEDRDFERRVANAAKGVFGPDDPAFSLYQIRSTKDLHRVLGGIAANRRKPDNIDAIFFSVDELVVSGIEIDDSVSGTLGCHAANLLHVDVSSPDREAFTTLCRETMTRGRQVRRFKRRTDVEPIVQRQTDAGCEAFGSGEVCPCHLE